MSEKIGYTQGELCNRGKCNGIIEESEKESSCSCHINPPCSSCVDDRNYCPECNWSGLEDQKSYVPPKDSYEPYKVRTLADLDRTKIDWLSMMHTHFTMKKVGVYPETATEEDVRKEVNGTFGGRFLKFGNGEFEFVAYTD